MRIAITITCPWHTYTHVYIPVWRKNITFHGKESKVKDYLSLLRRLAWIKPGF
jgi:hypothetical protein